MKLLSQTGTDDTSLQRFGLDHEPPGAQNAKEFEDDGGLLESPSQNASPHHCQRDCVNRDTFLVSKNHPF